ncbi:MAG: zinc metalloprotease HtpX [Acidimicrobiales bacterium]
MAIERRIPADRGLTVRMLMTAFFLGLLYVVVIGVLFAVGISAILILVIAGGLFIAQFFFSDKIALYGMGGHVVTPEQAPELHAVVDRLCALADMKKPQVAIADTDIPNAFATGRDQKHAVLCATRGILRRLDEPELEAVLAHEISHVAHRDVMVMTIASFLGVLAGLVTRVFFYLGLFGGFGGGGGRGGRNGQNIVLIELGIMVFSMIIYAISFILTMALSRYRELAADRSGAILIGRPALLASALVKVSGETARIPTRDLRSAEHFNAFFFSPISARGFSVSTLFSTHPPLQKRLDQLNRLEAEMDKG